ncbi:MAG TPA: hypothetical protein VK502_03115 [Candidatus Saccharimonadales bacterium]|nr:hypothetical protein [Candidatus Saccharimonadales bacterium]
MQPTMTIDEITTKLEALQDDPTMTTKSIYSPSAIEYPGNQLPLVQIHLAYLRKNKHVDASRYISNLQIMIKKRK